MCNCIKEAQKREWMIFSNLDQLEKIFSSRDYEEAAKLIDFNKEKKTSYPKKPKSYLMLSANKLKHLNKLDQLEADAVIINLEDGVAPEEKKIALYMAAIFISHCHTHSTKIIVRTNPLDKHGTDEISLLNRVLPDAIRVSKITSVQESQKAAKLIDKNIEIHYSIETKEVLPIIGHLRVDERITTYFLGILDMTASLGLNQNQITPENPTINHLLSTFLINSLSAGVEPVFFTYQDYTKLEHFCFWCKMAKSMGYNATSCISPKQVIIANRVFAPSETEVEKAKEIIELFTKQANQGVTGFSHKKYGFIDEPIYKGMRAILDRI